MPAKGPRNEKSTLVRGMELLELLLERHGRTTMRSLADAWDVQPSTVHRTLHILQDADFLMRRPDGSLAVGPRLLRLAVLALENVDPHDIIHQVLTEIRTETGETCVLFLLKQPDAGEVFVAHVVTSSQPLQYRVGLGHTHAVTAGASGLAALAFMPGDIQAAILARPLPRYTPGTIVDPRELRERLQAIRDQGYALTRGEHIAGAVGVAVPVFDSSQTPQRVIGTLCLTIPAERFNDANLDRYLTLLHKGARSLSVTLTTLSRSPAPLAQRADVARWVAAPGPNQEEEETR